MLSSLFANQTVVQDEVARVFGLNRLWASLLVLGLTTLGTLLGTWLWALLVKLQVNIRYGGWNIRVSGGRSGRTWHMPLDTSMVKALRTRNYVAFKRDLGTILSGEGQVDFSLGVPRTEPCRHAPPQAPGLTIDFANRLIEMNFAAGKPAVNV